MKIEIKKDKNFVFKTDECDFQMKRLNNPAIA